MWKGTRSLEDVDNARICLRSRDNICLNRRVKEWAVADRFGELALFFDSIMRSCNLMSEIGSVSFTGFSHEGMLVVVFVHYTAAFDIANE